MLYRSLHRPLVSCAVIAALSLAACSKKEPAATAVEEVPLSQISADLAAGKTNAVAVTKAYIARIKAEDGPLHAIIRIAPDALDQAAASDKRRAAGQALGPLDGVPILVKDNIDVVGMPTTAGSYALIDNLPAKDSEVARRLRTAGVVILGKTNMSQWAGLRTSEAFNGSTVGGSPKDPYDLTRSPAGSSSGSAIATAVSFSAAAVGTDTTGSVISPANNNGVVGLRPTVALIARRGIVPISLTQDTAGPMGRNVKDVAMLLNVIAGSDPADPASKDADAHKTDYTTMLAPDALKGKRLGVMRQMRDYNDATKAIFDAALEVLKAQGAELVELPPDVLEDLSQEDRTILTTDFKEDVNAYLANTPPAVKTRSLADLIEFNKTEEHEKLHSEDMFEAAEASKGRQDPDYIKVLDYAKNRAGVGGIDKALADYNVSALVVLTKGPAEVLLPDGPGGTHPVGEHPKGAVPPSPSMNAAISGDPDLTVPMGMVNGLPIGLSFLGPAWSEATLLSYGYAYEQAAHARIPPAAYKATVNGQ